MVTSFCPDGIAPRTCCSMRGAPAACSTTSTRRSRWIGSHAGEPVPYIGPHGLCRVRSRAELHRRPIADAAARSARRATRRCRCTAAWIPTVHQPVAAVDDYSRGPLVPRHVCRRSAGRRRTAVPRAGAPAPGSALRARRLAVPGRISRGRRTCFTSGTSRPDQHPAFYCSSRLTLNVTRRPMAEIGYCPSGRLFEAAACGVADPVGLLGGARCSSSSRVEEILVASSTAEAIAALHTARRELREIARAGAAHARSRSTPRERGARRARTDSASTQSGRESPSCGASFRRRARARGFSRSRSRRNCCRSAAASTAAVERPRAVSEYLVERMIAAGADKLCFVISPGKSDILEYYGGAIGGARICYVVQREPAGLCDAIFQAAAVHRRRRTGDRRAARHALVSGRRPARTRRRRALVPALPGGASRALRRGGHRRGRQRASRFG